MVGRVLSGPGALRLMLALAVFAHHLSRVAVGAAAVHVFFVLSGFWVCRMWTDRYSRAPSPYLTYMASRLWRLLPVFVLFAAPFLAISVARGHPLTAHALASSGLILGYASLAPVPLAPAWSLDIELQFYLLAPALILLAGRMRPAVLLAIAAAVSGAAVLAGGRGLVTPYLVFFAVGICAAVASWRPTRGLALAGLAVGALASAALVASPWRDVVLGGASPGPLHRFNELYNLALAGCVIPYALWTTGNRAADRRAAARDAMFADLSYVVYLAHWGAAMWLGDHALGGGTLRRAALTAAAVAVTLAGSWLVWRFYDRPLNTLRARWVTARIARREALTVAFGG